MTRYEVRNTTEGQSKERVAVCRSVLVAFDKKISCSVEFDSQGPLAQLVEQLTLNQRVAGSSPARLTCKISRLEPLSRWL